MKFLKRSALIVMILIIPFIMTSCSSSQDALTFTGDRPVRGEVEGTIYERSSDEENPPLENVSIQRTDSNKITYSESDGSYRLDGVDNNTEITVASEGYESESRTVEVEEDGDEHKLNFSLNKISEVLIFKLSWQKGAEDLDAHLVVPDASNSEQVGYNIFYQDKGNDSEYPRAFLDEDIKEFDINRPEVMTVNKLYEGRYTYFIKNFSMYDAEDGEETPEISESGAMVRVRENGEWTEYNAPENQEGMYWHLFDIEVTEDGYQIIEINEITDDISEIDPERN